MLSQWDTIFYQINDHHKWITRILTIFILNLNKSWLFFSMEVH